MKRIIAEEGLTQITPDDLNDLIIQHETNPSQIDYQTFLSGKLFIEKPFSCKHSFKKQEKEKEMKEEDQRASTASNISTSCKTERILSSSPLVYIKKTSIYYSFQSI